MLMFLSEHGVPASRGVLERAPTRVFGTTDHAIRCFAIAEALGTSDQIQLGSAIDEAEAHGLMVHAVRMGIALAQHTGARSQLRACPGVLERSPGRQFLRRHAEVEVALGERASSVCSSFEGRG
jgi:hypothetical protein